MKHTPKLKSSHIKKKDSIKRSNGVKGPHLQKLQQQRNMTHY